MKVLKLGTRASKLAMTQSQWVADELQKHHRDLKIELVLITTQGDKIIDKPLTEVGGKGLFLKEIEEALIKGEVDFAVHSLKDVPAQIPEELVIASIPKRVDPRDVLISKSGEKLNHLKPGSKIGTSSLRRLEQLKKLRPDLQFIPMRGNVDTRLKKLKAGETDGIILAAAGLIRLGLEKEVTEYLDIIPSVGQGALCLEARKDDKDTLSILQTLNDPLSYECVQIERIFQKTIGGGCEVPMGAYVREVDKEIFLIDAFLVHHEKFQIKSVEVSKKDADKKMAEIAKEFMS